MLPRLLYRLGCFIGMHFVSYDSIAEWVDGRTPHCPRCGKQQNYGPPPRIT